MPVRIAARWVPQGNRPAASDRDAMAVAAEQQSTKEQANERPQGLRDHRVVVRHRRSDGAPVRRPRLERRDQLLARRRAGREGRRPSAARSVPRRSS
jgi:hypothetical protein